jgi:arylsulfatase A-like enzyme
VTNEITSHEDWLPTFLAAAGDADLKEKLLQRMKGGDKTFKTHLDGYNFLPFFKGETEKGPRHEIFYFDDNANLNALRYNNCYNNYKITYGWIEGNLFYRQTRYAECVDRYQVATGPIRALSRRVGYV